MVTINRIQISPALLNSSCAWASEEAQLHELYDSDYTGAVTTRTSTLNGFAEDSPAVHTVTFSSETITSLNSYGYSPHPLSTYLTWIESMLASDNAKKPILISITSSNPSELEEMVDSIQKLRTKLNDSADNQFSRIAIELNTSCPNITYSPPPAYNPTDLSPLLEVLAKAYHSDRTLTIGLKLTPYTYVTQFSNLIEVVRSYTTEMKGELCNPFSFFTCTNTLGSSLLFTEQTTTAFPYVSDTNDNQFALPTPLGGLAGEAIHSLSLGNVYTFSQLLAKSEDPCMNRIVIIGVGGVTTPAAVSRMRKAGAQVVACATLLGRMGVRAFEILSSV